MMKRKRPCHASHQGPRKATRLDTSPSASRPDDTVLRVYYPIVQSLRSYLLSKIPPSGQKRSKYLSQYGTGHSQKHDSVEAQDLADLLDTTLIGRFDHQQKETSKAEDEIKLFSQIVSDSTPGRRWSQGCLSQSEIVDFVIWSLFQRHGRQRPPNILCHGFVRNNAAGLNGLKLTVAPGIPGLITVSPNQYVEKVKAAPWTALPHVIGKNADKILIDLFRDCAVFVPLAGNSGSLNQISGKPLSDLSPLQIVPHSGGTVTSNAKHTKLEYPRNTTKWNDIRFIRSRILYGRPMLNSTGRVAFGLRPIHVLNRLRMMDEPQARLHILKYVFPRQHSLHNAFTSVVDRRESAHRFLDYTLREQEIRQQALQRVKCSVPKRLRGPGQVLLAAALGRHAECPFEKLLNHYCPPLQQKTSSESDNVLGYASNKASVSAFCRAAINRVFPSQLWGQPATGNANRDVIMRAVDKFIRLQRYESMTLHEVMQGIKFPAITWLDHPQHHSGQHLSSSDYAKRKEIFAELVYYVFDSFLIPLINSNFYVTESSSNRNQLFYFRHDQWQRLSAPALSELRTSMFEEIEQRDVDRLMSRRTLGTSHVRLVPKEAGMRPIINLRRRVLTVLNGKAILGKSINSAMTPVYHVLNYEKDRDIACLGASIFSADEIFPKLQAFRSSLFSSGLERAPLYFAKADVRSCFDTIPQQALMGVVSSIFKASEYAIGRYAEAKAYNKTNGLQVGFGPSIAWKFLGLAGPADQDETLSQSLQRLMSGEKAGNVFVDAVVRRYEGRGKLLELLEEHIQNNLVQMDKKTYRQKKGIPQGSIVSSLLCSLFYADMEAKVLGFIKQGDSMLLRLIDDFLLVTTDKAIAQRFMQVMHDGLPKYGVDVKRAKSLVNFDIDLDGRKVSRLPDTSNFPYCGHLINTQSLNISKDAGRRTNSSVLSSVTVEFSKLPGQSFYRKTLRCSIVGQRFFVERY